MNRTKVKEVKMIIAETSIKFEGRLEEYLKSVSPQYEVDVQYAIKDNFYTALVIVRDILI